MKRALIVLFAVIVAHAQTPRPDPPMEQTKKNIKVLTGVPTSQLIPIMTVMANSLGVPCNYCHEAAWESDAKPMKEAGRRMIKLTRALNDTHYAGKTVLTCNTCHRGRVETVDTPLVADAGYNRVDESHVVKPILPPASEIIDAYRRVSPAAITNRHAKGIATAVSGRADPRSGPFELFQTRNPDSAKLDTEVPYPPEGSRELQSLFFREMKYPDAKTVGTERIRGRDAWVVEVAPGERFAFDAVRGVALRREREIPTLVGPLPEQYDFDDYRTVDGVLVPFLMQWSRGDYQVTHRFVEVRQNVTKE